MWHLPNPCLSVLFLAFWLASSFTMEPCEERLAPDSCSLDDRFLMPSAPSSLSYMQSSSPSVKMMDRLNTLTAWLDHRSWRTSERVVVWRFLTVWSVRYVAKFTRLVVVTGNVRRNFSGQRGPVAHRFDHLLPTSVCSDFCLDASYSITDLYRQMPSVGRVSSRERRWHGGHSVGCQHNADTLVTYEALVNTLACRRKLSGQLTEWRQHGRALPQA